MRACAVCRVAGGGNPELATCPWFVPELLRWVARVRVAMGRRVIITYPVYVLSDLHRKYAGVREIDSMAHG